jgi:hypothetical protein
MQKVWLALVTLVLAVVVSTGVSYLLWGQQGVDGEASVADVQMNELAAKVAKIENTLQKTAGAQSGRAVTYEEFDLVLSRLENLERREREPRAANVKSGVEPESAPGDLPPGDLAEQKIRQVYEDIKDEERRKREEEREKQREEQRRERENYVTGVYTEHLDRLCRELALTPNQERAVRQALEVRKQSMMRMYDSWGLSREERKDRGILEWDEVNAIYDTSIKQILNQEQYEQYKRKRLDDFSGRGRGGGQGR